MILLVLARWAGEDVEPSGPSRPEQPDVSLRKTNRT
jgi:hypothetical protein